MEQERKGERRRLDRAHCLFRGHPANPYYEAMDGVGYLLYALLQLDLTLREPQRVLANKTLFIGPNDERSLGLDNW